MKSVQELKELRERSLVKVALREKEEEYVLARAGKTPIYYTVLYCAGTGCTASGSADIGAELVKSCEAHGIAGNVSVVKTGCFGLCQKGPIVAVYPDEIFYNHIQVSDVERIVTDHLIGGVVCDDLQMTDIDPETKETIFDITQSGN